MRALSDALPTLQEDPAFAAPGDDAGEAPAFSPDLIAKALGARRTGRVDPGAPLAEIMEAGTPAPSFAPPPASVRSAEPETVEFEPAGDPAPATSPAMSSAMSPAPGGIARAEAREADHVDAEYDIPDIEPHTDTETVKTFRARVREIRDTSAHAYDDRLASLAPSAPGGTAHAESESGPAPHATPSAAQPGAKTRSAKFAIPQDVPLLEPVREEKAPDHEKRIKDAVETALAEAQREHEAALDALRAEAEAAATARLVETRAQWTREEGERLAAAFEAQLNELRLDLTDAVASVLKPLVNTTIRDRALERFATLLSRLSHDAASPFLTVHGPQDLLDALADKLHGITTVSLQQSPSADLSVRIGDTEIRTTFADWAAEIELSEVTD